MAPLASESPELIVACLYALRLKASHSLGTLLSSKVNQWTLLVGTLPVVLTLAATTFDGLPIDTNQRFKLLITAAQSLFAVSLLTNLNLSVRGAAALFVLFIVQFTVSITVSPAAKRVVIVALSVLYGVLAVALLARRFRATRRTVRDGLVTLTSASQYRDGWTVAKLDGHAMLTATDDVCPVLGGAQPARARERRRAIAVLRYRRSMKIDFIGAR